MNPRTYPMFNHSREVDMYSSSGPSFRVPANFCGFPVSREADGFEGLVGALVRGPVLKLARALGTFRHFLACSRPRIHRSPDVEETTMLTKSEAPQEVRMKPKEMKVLNVECMRMKIELQAVLRHLEVRWQLFNEAMTKWCDLEAMLAICTDNVTWSGRSGVVISGKNSPLLSQDLRSLLERKLSLNVVIERITRLSPMVCPDLSVDKDGNYIELQDSEMRNSAASLNILLGKRKKDIYSEDCWYKDVGPYMVLEKDRYTLQDTQGAIVEEGSRTVLWKQHNSTWYIRACLISPSSGEIPSIS